MTDKKNTYKERLKAKTEYKEYIKAIKKLCIQTYGIGFYFTNPSLREILIEHIEETLDELVNIAFDNIAEKTKEEN